MSDRHAEGKTNRQAYRHTDIHRGKQGDKTNLYVYLLRANYLLAALLFVIESDSLRQDVRRPYFQSPGLIAQSCDLRTCTRTHELASRRLTQGIKSDRHSYRLPETRVL